jgi:hypothetical protein
MKEYFLNNFNQFVLPTRRAPSKINTLLGSTFLLKESKNRSTFSFIFHLTYQQYPNIKKKSNSVKATD